MELSPIEQAVALLRQSTTPLILLPSAPSSDALAAGLALLLLAEKLGKSAKIVSPNFVLPPGHDFLAKSDAVEQRLTSLRNFVISVDLRQTKLDTLSYDVRDDRLHIYLAPKMAFSKDATSRHRQAPLRMTLLLPLIYSARTTWVHSIPTTRNSFIKYPY